MRKSLGQGFKRFGPRAFPDKKLSGFHREGQSLLRWSLSPLFIKAVQSEQGWACVQGFPQLKGFRSLWVLSGLYRVQTSRFFCLSLHSKCLPWTQLGIPWSLIPYVPYLARALRFHLCLPPWLWHNLDIPGQPDLDNAFWLWVILQGLRVEKPQLLTSPPGAACSGSQAGRIIWWGNKHA